MPSDCLCSTCKAPTGTDETFSKRNWQQNSGARAHQNGRHGKNRRHWKTDRNDTDKPVTRQKRCKRKKVGHSFGKQMFPFSPKCTVLKSAMHVLEKESFISYPAERWAMNSKGPPALNKAVSWEERSPAVPATTRKHKQNKHHKPWKVLHKSTTDHSRQPKSHKRIC